MTYRSLAWREVGWGGAAFVLSTVLAGCPGGGGGGGCPELEGTWQVQGNCTNGPTSCEVEQDGCAITLDCSDGRTLEGTASTSSISFKDDEVSCSGSLDDLEDDDENGVINPTIEAECTPTGGDACDIEAICAQGDCTVPEDEDNGGGDGDGDGDGPAGQGGGSGFLGGNGGIGGSGAGGISGEGGVGGLPPAGQGGFSGGVSGEGGVGGMPPAGNGGVGGSVSNSCTSCVEIACAVEASACTSANGCEQAASCVYGSGCYLNDEQCLTNACGTVPDPNDEGLTALSELFYCTGMNCANDCPISDEPIGPAPQPCDTCEWANDGFCDEGVDCAAGTDCSDCGGGSGQ